MDGTFWGIVTAAVPQKELGGTCITKGSAFLMEEKNVFINVSVDPMQEEALAFQKKPAIELPLFYFRVICCNFSFSTEVFINYQVIS